MKRVDFYFDFLSPYAYLAAHRLPDLVERHRGAVEFVPQAIDLVAARFAAGNTGPFNREIPRKIRALTADLRRWANRYGIPLNFPKGFDTANLNRGHLCAAKESKSFEFLRAGFELVYGEGGDPSDPSLLRQAAARCGLPPEKFLEHLSDPALTSAYDRLNRDAQERGVFGVPTFLVDDQIFWGNDRIDFLEEYLADPSKGVKV